MLRFYQGTPLKGVFLLNERFEVYFLEDLFSGYITPFNVTMVVLFLLLLFFTVRVGGILFLPPKFMKLIYVYDENGDRCRTTLK